MKDDKLLMKALHDYGENLVFVLKKELLNAGKSATGTLINSIKTEIFEGSEGKYQVEIKAADYLIFVDQGRRPGKQPPLKEIIKWTQIKGISPKAAFPIARSIGQNGIKPTNVIKKSTQQLKKSVSFKKLSDGIKSYIDEMVSTMIKNTKKIK